MGVNVIDFLIIAKNGARSMLGEIKDKELANIEYFSEGMQTSLFDLFIETKNTYLYEMKFPQLH